MYVAPFRKDLKRGHCIICAKPTNARYATKGEKEEKGGDIELCTCISATNCQGCKVWKYIINITYKNRYLIT